MSRTSVSRFQTRNALSFFVAPHRSPSKFFALRLISSLRLYFLPLRLVVCFLSVVALFVLSPSFSCPCFVLSSLLFLVVKFTQLPLDLSCDFSTPWLVGLIDSLLTSFSLSTVKGFPFASRANVDFSFRGELRRANESWAPV